MAPLIGKEMSESIFLERFAALCIDPLFHVRKVCAANFGDFSNVVGSESTEQILVRITLRKATINPLLCVNQIISPVIF